MSRDVPTETRGLSGETLDERPPITGDRGRSPTAKNTVYRGHRDPAAPVGEEVEVTADGEPLDCRYDLLSASPSGLEFGYGGSGPAQLAVAMLAHAFDDEFACEYYQRFKHEVVANLPEEGWTLTKTDLDEWRREMIADA
ncbi:DUF6166 domain-containing protein [Haloplanus halobius]|uniref:DUF6166 domain-containing protein n=1 Tax=Haloplanus halobius TaxID=2934938 RepID=UPI00200D0949|nr:DUF6166 domain-containing protein [Haloplanus sp. XH21]